MVYLACGEACFRSPDRAGHWENISPKNHDYGTSVAEDKNGVVYVGAAQRTAQSYGFAKKAPMPAIFRSSDKGKTWEKVTDNLNRRRHAHVSRRPDGNGMVAGTSDGTLLLIDDCRRARSRQRPAVRHLGGTGSVSDKDAMPKVQGSIRQTWRSSTLKQFSRTAKS